MSRWRSALSYLIIKNAPIALTDGFADLNPQLAMFAALNCYNISEDSYDIDKLAVSMNSIGTGPTAEISLRDVSIWLENALKK